MKPIQRVILAFMAVFVGAGPTVIAATEEGIFLDPATGDYTVRYTGYGGVVSEITYYPHTKIDPTVKSKVMDTNDGSIVYRYRVKNGKDSKQNLISLRVTSSQAIVDSQNAPPGWDAGINPVSSAHPLYGGVGNFVSWGFVNKLALREGISTKGLLPGASQEFEFRSLLLPGAGVMNLWGSAQLTRFPDDGPDYRTAVGQALNKLLQNDFISRFVAVPRIQVPDPYEAVTVLTNIQKHLATDLVSMKLVDPSLVAQMDPWFAAAIDAAKRNNTEGLRHALKELRRLLKQQHPDVEDEEDKDVDDRRTGSARIARLAARVLDFDLRFVERRVAQ